MYYLIDYAETSGCYIANAGQSTRNSFWTDVRHATGFLVLESAALETSPCPSAFFYSCWLLFSRFPAP